jgi:hypothetical protein
MFAVIMERYLHGRSTPNVDVLVKALGVKPRQVDRR